jgi:hypothetical protein
MEKYFGKLVGERNSSGDVVTRYPTIPRIIPTYFSKHFFIIYIYKSMIYIITEYANYRHFLNTTTRLKESSVTATQFRQF